MLISFPFFLFMSYVRQSVSVHRSVRLSTVLVSSPRETDNLIINKCLRGFIRIISIHILLGSGSEGADDLCFHTGEISPPPSPPSPSTPFKAQIPVVRPKSQSRCSKPSHQAENSSLQAQIPASRLKFSNFRTKSQS